MNNPADDGSSDSTSTTARMEQDTSKVMVLRSKDIVKLTNLTAKQLGNCETYHNQCNRRNKRLRTELQIVKSSAAQSFLHKQQNWMLHGDVFINVEGWTAFHLKLSLSAGNLEESVQLVASLEHCSKRRNETIVSFLGIVRSIFFTRAVHDCIQSLVCTITFLDKNLKNIGDTRCFQLAKQFNGEDYSYFYYNGNFCSQSALMEACQVSPDAANTVVGTSSSFEFVDVKIETTIRFNARSQVLMKGSQCYTRAFQLKQSSSKEYRSSKTETIAEPTMEFTEILVLKAGDGSPEKFYVHKDKLIQESPVFARMFDVSMTENTTGEAILKDCTVTVLEAFIGFLYENVNESQFDERVDIFLDVLAFAHHYDTKRIVQRMQKMIIALKNEVLNLKLALRIYAAGQLCEMPDLKFRAVQWIKCNKTQLQTAEGRKEVQAVIESHQDLGSFIIAEVLSIL